MRFNLLSALFTLMLVSCVSPSKPPEQTRVTVVASMHRYHANHPTYDFDRLYGLVRAQNPDLVGVEIRPEDIGADENYLAKSYPPEMIALTKEYGPRAFGFDWLGDEIAGRPIPDNWWKEQSEIKTLERRLAADKAMEDPAEEELARKQNELLERVTASPLTDGRYDRLVRERRRLFARKAGAGPYAPIVRFTEERERRIGDNIVQMIRANPGRRFVLVMGADHHGFAVERLRQEFGDQVVLEPVP